LNEDKNKPAYWIFLIISGSLSLYTHNLAVFILIVPDIIIVIKRKWRLLWRIIKVQFVIFLLFIPWVLYLPKQFAKVQTAFWTPRPGIVQILQGIISLPGNLPLDNFSMAVCLFFGIAILIFLLLFAIRNRKRYPNIILLIIVAILPPLLMLIISYIVRPVFLPRSMLTSYYALLIIAACLISNELKQFSGIFLSVAFTVSSCLSLFHCILSMVSLGHRIRRHLNTCLRLMIRNP